jgi:hypothetical protein
MHPIYWILALALAAIFAGLWVWTVQAQILPPGTDESTWLLTAYAYLGVPVPAIARPGAYPPFSFPFLTVAVLVGNGPVWGARLFTVALYLGIGLSSFLFGRTLLRLPSMALLAEGLLLAEPDFSQIYYFAGYPNLVALICFFVSFAYLVRYLRSRNGTHLIIFWTALTLCILSHTLTGVFLLGGVLLFLGMLLLVDRMPRTVLFSRAGLVGALIAGLGIGGYYLVTFLAGVPHPAYLDSGAIGVSKLGLIPAVTKPYYLPVLVDPLTHASSFTPTLGQSIAFFAAATVGLVALLLLLRFLRPGWLRTPWLAIAGCMMAVWVGTLVGYWHAIDTDYRRFAYFLYLPNILVVALAADSTITWAMARKWTPRVRGRPALSTATGGATVPQRGRRSGRSWRRWVEPVSTVVVIGIVLGAGYYYTNPQGQLYEAYFAHVAHDTTFYNAMNVITDSGIPGSILSTTPADGHWPSAVTERPTYAPAATGQNQFGNTLIEDSELAGLTLAGRYSVNNGLVAGTIPGVMPGRFNASPVYSVFDTDVVQQILQVSTSSMQLSTVRGPLLDLVPPGSAAPPVAVIDGGYGFQVVYSVPGAQVTENVTTPPNVNALVVSFFAQNTAGSPNLTGLLARVATVENIHFNVSGTAIPGEFEWNSSTLSGPFTTFGNVTPTAALAKIVIGNATTPPSVFLKVGASNGTVGVHSLSFSLNLSTPGASNIITGVPTWVTAPATWSGFSIRFIVDYNQSGGLGPQIPPSYFEWEFGATVLTVDGAWTILLLPSPVAGPADPAY